MEKSVKLSEVVNAVPVLNAITATKVKGRTAFRVARILRALMPLLDSFNESRKIIADQESDPAKLELEVLAVLNEQVTVSIDLITQDELNEFSLSPVDCLQIEWMIAE